MTITFPNRSRSYDATRRAVRFWGYDRSMENSFFIMADALQRMQPDLQFDAVDILRAFDVNRERIYTIAAKVYAPEDARGLTILTSMMFENCLYFRSWPKADIALDKIIGLASNSNPMAHAAL
jgi:Protein of unknown function (DUF1488)